MVVVESVDGLVGMKGSEPIIVLRNYLTAENILVDRFVFCFVIYV